MKPITFLTAGAVALATTTVSADIIDLNFFLSGDQEVPANDSDAAGAGRIIFDTDTNLFSIDIMVYGITLGDLFDVGPNSTPIHIHNAPAGAAGPIVVDLGYMSDFQDDGLGIRLRVTDQLFGGTQGGVDSDPEANELALLAGDLYVNIHTNDFSSGELRGQLLPAPGSLALLAGAGLLAGRRRRE
jgi:hypothetical protein